MIPLTRLNRQIVFINAALVERVEATPDVVVTLTTGRRVTVRESLEQVLGILEKGEGHPASSGEVA